ncbi:MAG: winged helix-turn-helix domain-containing protein [Anaerolineaceae bacterium]|nr:winged helix-turn-helix domain-containing protein [Anaerolineaceae bacterium]
MSGSGQDRQALVDGILSILSAPDGQTVTQRELASRVGRSKTTINTILRDMTADGLLQRTDSGQYVIAGHNGHHEPAARSG